MYQRKKTAPAMGRNAQKENELTTEEKGNLIGRIVQQLKISAMANERYDFCAGSVFFSLAFKTDAELKQIASLAGVSLN